MAGCVSPVKIEKHAVAVPAQAVDPTRLASLKLDRISATISRGTRIGASYSLYRVCGGDNAGEIYWSGHKLDKDFKFADTFYEEMTSANFRVVGDPKRMFESDRERPEFLVGAQITHLQINLCDQLDFILLYNTGNQRGEASISVTWHVYSNLERRVVYTGETKGYSKLEDGVPSGKFILVENAFGAAVKNLAAKEDFVAVLRRDRSAGGTEAAPINAETLKVARVPTFTRPIVDNMARARRATVTIDLGRQGHGSGFFITSDGHIVTNSHVVGEADRVAVRLASGTTLRGQVLRRHKLRDVALVKIDALDTGPLPIRESPPTVGEEVYAVGTPIDRSLSATVSKGIVSALRIDEHDSQPYIQADVDIHGGNSGGPLLDARGNLVGIAVAGVAMGQGKTSSGLNLFIPIDDALAKLRLELVDPERVSTMSR